MRRSIARSAPRPRAPRTAAGAGALAAVLLVALALRVAHVLALRDTPWFTQLDLDPAYDDA